MAWQAPKINWAAADGVRDSDFNRIEENILYLYNRRANADVTVYVSTSGNDSTGDGSYAKPYRTVTKALNSVPRVTEGKTITVDINAGTYSENVVIKDFVGSVVLQATGVVTITSINIDNSTVLHAGQQLNFPSGMLLKNGAAWIGAPTVYVGSAQIGIAVETGSTFIVYGTVTISNASSAALDVSGCSRAYVATLGGSTNVIGARAISGSIIAYGSMSISATTQRVTNTGGRIYTGAQTNMPNY